MTKLQKLIKYFAIASLFLLALVPIVSYAAEFYPRDNGDSNEIRIQSTQQNVYAAGNSIISSESVRGDLNLAGNTIEVTGLVGRNVQAAGYTITIDSESINGAVRAAGNEIIITGNIVEEVVVAGNTVTIRNANIRGDLIVSANTLIIENSVISGDANVTYTSGVSRSELDQSVAGELTISDVDEDELARNALVSFVISTFLFQLSVIIVLALLAWWLSRRNRLELANINFGAKFWIRLGLGFAMGILVPIAFIILVLIQFILPAFVLLFGYLALLFAAIIYTPIYLANAIRNSFAKQASFVLVLILTYVIVTVLNLIPLLNFVTIFIYSLISLSSLGYLTQKLAMSVGGKGYEQDPALE
jgi:hypothetical protein